jgi:uncharacterized membrane protein
MARVVMGALAGACISVSAGRLLMVGMVLGALGGLIGAFAGFELRRRLVSGLRVQDPVIAILEDMVAIGLAYVIVSWR